MFIFLIFILTGGIAQCFICAFNGLIITVNINEKFIILLLHDLIIFRFIDLNPLLSIVQNFLIILNRSDFQCNRERFLSTMQLGTKISPYLNLTLYSPSPFKPSYAQNFYFIEN